MYYFLFNINYFQPILYYINLYFNKFRFYVYNIFIYLVSKLHYIIYHYNLYYEYPRLTSTPLFPGVVPGASTCTPTLLNHAKPYRNRANVKWHW